MLLARSLCEAIMDMHATLVLAPAAYPDWSRWCAGLGIRAVATRRREAGDSSSLSSVYDSLCQLIGLKAPGGATGEKSSSGQTGGDEEGSPEKPGEGGDKTKQVSAVATEVVSTDDLQTKRLRVVFNDETQVPEGGAGGADAAVKSVASPTGAAAGASAAGAAGAAGVATNSTDRDLLSACVKIYNVYMQEFEKELVGNGTAAALKEDAAAVVEVKAKTEEKEKRDTAVAQAKAEARAADRKDSVKTRVGATPRPKPPAPRLSEGARQEKPVGKNGGKSSVGGGVGSCTSTITGKSMLQHQMAAVTARAE